MAIKRTRKSMAPPKRNAMPQRPAKQPGNIADRDKAADKIVKFSKRPASAQLRQAAAEAQVVARNHVMVDSVRLRGKIGARLNAGA